jgi:tetratricopeptide (TPR) repeat protein
MTIANIEIPDEFSMEWEQIGLMHLSSRNPAAALQAFQESGKYKDSYHLRNNIGNAYAAMGQIDAALEQFRTGERMNAAQPVSPFSIGTAHASRQEWQPALNAFDRAISINPRFAPAHLNKGLVLFHMQQFEAALNELRIYTTLETDPSKLGSVIGDIRNLERLVEQQRAAKSQVTPQGKR